MNYKYDNVVVGSSFDAVLFAFIHNYPIIYSDHDIPFRFDYLDHNIDLSALKIDNRPSVIKTSVDDVVVGLPKVLLWERMLFLLSLDSKAPLSSLCKSLRRKDNKIICSNEYSKIAEIKFATCHYFYDQNAFNFVNEKTLASDKYICYDWIAINRGGKQEIDLIETNDDFTKEMWFYPSDRIDGRTSVKDVCAVSILTEKQISDFNYSETMARFKLVHEMEKRGMKGPSNGYGPNGKLKHYKIRATSVNRSVRKLEHKITPKTSNIKIAQIIKEDYYAGLPKACLGYDRFLRHL
tara:strand:+ start:2048 stop:2929 length:882 start_codon:yes stop_codon:yes gene_type:complete